MHPTKSIIRNTQEDSSTELAFVVQRLQSQKPRPIPQLFLDPQQLVVLGYAVGAGGAACLDLARTGRNREVGDESVFGFAGAVGDDAGVSVAAGEVDGVEGFADGADLVDFDQNAVGDVLVDSLLQEFDVGDEEVVADQLDFVAEFFGQVRPAVPVVLGKAVLERDAGIVVHPLGVEADHVVGSLYGFVGFLEHVFAVLKKFAGGGVEGDGDFFTRLVSSLSDSFENDFNRLGV